MIQSSQDGSTLFLEVVLRDYLHKEMQSKGTQTFWAGKGVEYLVEVFPEGVDSSPWAQCETLLPHILIALTYELAEPDAKFFHASLFCKTATYSRQLGNFDDAHHKYRKALNIYQEIKRKDAFITLETANHVVNSLYYLKRHDEAEKVSLSVLNSYKKCLPQDHYLVLDLYNSLNIISQALGKYEKSLEYGMHAITRHEKIYGIKHLDTLVAKWNLASTLLNVYQYSNALEIYEEILAAYREKHDETYPDVPETMSAIASVLIELNQVEEGISMHDKAVEVMAQILEPTHPILMSMHAKFGKGLSTVGKLTEAAEIQRRSLDTYLLLHPSPSTQSLTPASHLGKIRKETFMTFL